MVSFRCICVYLGEKKLETWKQLIMNFGMKLNKWTTKSCYQQLCRSTILLVIQIVMIKIQYEYEFFRMRDSSHAAELFNHHKKGETMNGSLLFVPIYLADLYLPLYLRAVVLSRGEYKHFGNKFFWRGKPEEHFARPCIWWPFHSFVLLVISP